MIRGSLVAAVALLALTLPAAALAKPAGLAPKAGAKLESAPAKVKLRAPWKLRSVHVWLNGHHPSVTRADVGLAELAGDVLRLLPAVHRQNLDPLAEPTFLRYGVRVVADTTFMVFSQENFRGSKETTSSRDTRYPPASLISTLFAELDPGGDPTRAASPSTSTRS